MVKKIIVSLVDYVCSEENPIRIKLMALKSLKWMYKGRESECVIAIDVVKIWESNINLENNDELMESILELIEVLMNFCVRKIEQQQSGGEEMNQLDFNLSLKRHVSTVDESSMTNILNTNLTILIQEMGKEIAKIDEMQGIDKENILNTEKEEPSLVHLKIWLR